MKIHLLGPSCSGTTTLGRALADELSVAHFDTDNFFWKQTEMPFTIKRPREERIAMLNQALSEHKGWVLSGSMLQWGNYLRSELSLIVYKYVVPEIRLARLKQREKMRFGNRILPGKDMHKIHTDFIEWALSYEDGGLDMRSRKAEEEWMSRAECPVIRLENDIPTSEELEIVLKKIDSGDNTSSVAR